MKSRIFFLLLTFFFSMQISAQKESLEVLNTKLEHAIEKDDKESFYEIVSRIESGNYDTESQEYIIFLILTFQYYSSIEDYRNAINSGTSLVPIIEKGDGKESESYAVIQIGI